ncbi:MAG: RusA family crossover junction endodeoxyribonuclease [Dehalococcoidia bacterium]
MTDFRLTIPGDPVSWQVYTKQGPEPIGVQKKNAWQDQIRFYLRAAWQQEPLEGPVTLDCDFFLPWLSSAPQKRTAAIKKFHAEQLVKKPDLDNLKKAFSDACEGILFHGDQQIVGGEPRKHLLSPDIYKDPFKGYTEIRFRPYGEPEPTGLDAQGGNDV